MVVSIYCYMSWSSKIPLPWSPEHGPIIPALYLQHSSLDTQAEFPHLQNRGTNGTDFTGLVWKLKQWIGNWLSYKGGSINDSCCYYSHSVFGSQWPSTVILSPRLSKTIIRNKGFFTGFSECWMYSTPVQPVLGQEQNLMTQRKLEIRLEKWAEVSH